MTRHRPGAARQRGGLRLLALVLAGAMADAAARERPDAALEAAVAAPHRPAAQRARDGARHPAETLRFFGLHPGMTVVEAWPGDGWYTAILAPLLRDRGRLYAAHHDLDDPATGGARRARLLAFRRMLAARPDLYDRVMVTALAPAGSKRPAPHGSADLALSFRNVHNWLQDGDAAPMLRRLFEALRPGGVLGIVDHRAAPGSDSPERLRAGYLTEAQVIHLCEAAGFRLLARAEINANPRDGRDHPLGVASLPPTLAGSERDRARHRAIGESDRMTLKFLRP